MSTLYVLLGSFVLLSLVQWLRPESWFTLPVRGRMALALLFLFTGTSHFFFVDAMTQMIPSFVPARELLVYVTGILEIAGALGLLLPRLQRLAGYALIVFLIGVLPANIYAAMNYTGM
ncbi:MAG: DoxX family protein, partial [Caldilineaceae bacterium]|nr:DoxX family protein [Caldilineaceae bacterium]